jgi:hypothetical protein
MGRRPSPALVVALIALFVSLGGVSYGLARDSVGTRAIVNNSVRTQDIRNGTIRRRDVKRDVLDNSRIKNSNLIAGQAGTAGLANAAFSSFHDGDISLPDGSPKVIGRLNVPAGRYVVNAKLTAFNSADNTSSPDDICLLKAGATVDTQNFDTQSSTGDDEESVALQLVHVFGRHGQIQLLCSDKGDGDVSALHTRITAQQVRAVSNRGF